MRRELKHEGFFSLEPLYAEEMDLKNAKHNTAKNYKKRCVPEINSSLNFLNYT